MEIQGGQRTSTKVTTDHTFYMSRQISWSSIAGYTLMRRTNVAGFEECLIMLIREVWLTWLRTEIHTSHVGFHLLTSGFNGAFQKRCSYKTESSSLKDQSTRSQDIKTSVGPSVEVSEGCWNLHGKNRNYFEGRKGFWQNPFCTKPFCTCQHAWKDKKSGWTGHFP